MKAHFLQLKIFIRGFAVSCLALTVIGCGAKDTSAAKTEPKLVDVDTKPAMPVKGAVCSSAATAFNTAFTTVKPMMAGNVPDGSGLLVHTIHGPGAGPTELHLDALQPPAMTPDADKTCGDYLNKGIYLPWCGSNQDPLTKK